MASLHLIRTQGFRRWYERQLIECHAWLVTCFLGIICATSGMEVSGQAAPGARWLGLALTVAGMVVGWFSWRHYRDMLAIAERLGEAATCPSCQAYAKFSVTAAGPMPLPDGGDADIDVSGAQVWLHARCRRCDEQWRIGAVERP